MKTWTVYLAGEIHSEWREEIASAAEKRDLPIRFVGPETDHSASDAAGDVLGPESDLFWRDHKSAKVNAIRTRTLINDADVVVVRFAAKYREWNASFDAGYAVAKGKPLITMHDDEWRHSLKEVDAAALAVAETAEQVVEVLSYVVRH